MRIRVLLISLLLLIAPANAQPTSWTVSFAGRSTTLSTTARRTIRHAADTQRRTRAPVDVRGSPDGSDLTRRRAQVVATELQRNGVPRSAVNVQDDFGRSSNREPLNNLVRISIRTPFRNRAR